MSDLQSESQLCSFWPWDQGHSLNFQFSTSWVWIGFKNEIVHVRACCKCFYYDAQGPQHNLSTLQSAPCIFTPNTGLRNTYVCRAGSWLSHHAWGSPQTAKLSATVRRATPSPPVCSALGLISVVPCAVYWAQKRCTVRGWGPLSCPNVFTPFPRTYAPRAAETTTPGPGQPTHYHPQLTAIEMIPHQVSPLR